MEPLTLDITSTELKDRLREGIVTQEHSEFSWSIELTIEGYSLSCEFESASQEEAIIYDLEVDDEIQNNGIGTAIIEVIESFIKEQTEAHILYADIGADEGATEHVLENKCGFDIVGVVQKETVGEVVQAEKIIRRSFIRI